MNLGTLGLALGLITFCNCYKVHYENVTSEVSFTEDLSSPVLSRRKRFLIFPDGSSFQLVFCTQTHGYLQVGDIVWFGSTTALAWELPSDPSIFNMFKGIKDFGANRRVDKNIFYLDEDGKVIRKVPYKRKPLANPAFAKRSIDSQTDLRKKLHDIQMRSNYLNGLHDQSIEFHRSGRISLYEKVEKVLQGLGWDGPSCIQRMLCEYAKERKDQGTFLGEIMKATFTLPKGRESGYDVPREGRDCPTLYPCEDLHGLSLYEYEQ